jgi:hypothetical protein
MDGVGREERHDGVVRPYRHRQPKPVAQNRRRGPGLGGCGLEDGGYPTSEWQELGEAPATVSARAGPVLEPE